MNSENVDATEVRVILRRLGLEQMEGSNNRSGEFWMTETHHPYFLPYGTRPIETFVAQAVNKALEDLT